MFQVNRNQAVQKPSPAQLQFSPLVLDGVLVNEEAATFAAPQVI